jgi:hypothetical protein
VKQKRMDEIEVVVVFDRYRRCRREAIDRSLQLIFPSTLAMSLPSNHRLIELGLGDTKGQVVGDFR